MSHSRLQKPVQRLNPCHRDFTYLLPRLTSNCSQGTKADQWGGQTPEGQMASAQSPLTPQVLVLTDSLARAQMTQTTQPSTISHTVSKWGKFEPHLGKLVWITRTILSAQFEKEVIFESKKDVNDKKLVEKTIKNTYFRTTVQILIHLQYFILWRHIAITPHKTKLFGDSAVFPAPISEKPIMFHN